jgi:histidinol-phosphate aminotransferase
MGNGSDEILSFCFQAYCDARTPAVIADVTYGFYAIFAGLYGAPVKKVPLLEDFSLDPATFAACGGTVFIANPNAPTARTLPLAGVEDILRANPGNIVVVDEAYVAFGAQSAIPLVPKYPNLVVVQTMSKSRSLAGARVGYAVANPARIAELNLIKFSCNPYNLNSYSMAAAVAALADDAYYEACIGKIKKARDFTVAGLTARGFSVLSGDANFVTAKAGFAGGAEYARALREKGVLVRHFPVPRIEGYVRITVGTEPMMQALLDATDKIMAERGVARGA